jgi:hypothetical protein
LHCHILPNRVTGSSNPWSQKRRFAMRVLIVLTSHEQLGDTGKKTGFWLEEFAAPKSSRPGAEELLRLLRSV